MRFKSENGSTTYSSLRSLCMFAKLLMFAHNTIGVDRNVDLACVLACVLVCAVVCCLIKEDVRHVLLVASARMDHTYNVTVAKSAYDIQHPTLDFLSAA